MILSRNFPVSLHGNPQIAKKRFPDIPKELLRVSPKQTEKLTSAQTDPQATSEAQNIMDAIR